MRRRGSNLGDWYYIGHYGQLGPLTREQLDELIVGGVILRDTYVWRTGMGDWLPADRVTDLADAFRKAEPFVSPPPPPGPRVTAPAPPPAYAQPQEHNYSPVPAQSQYYPSFSPVRSDKNRLAGGLLQLFLPGIGRIYLGYPAIGVLQLILMFCGIGAIWSFIDGIIILSGGLRMDGYGRQLPD